MHRRARHINPKDAGARIALDSRFISGLSNGASVSTWSNRTGANDFTGSGTARPSFTESSMSGNPAVTFDGVDDTMAASGINWGADFSLIFVSRLNRSTPYSHIQIDCIACKTNYIAAPTRGFLAYSTNTFISTTQPFAYIEVTSTASGANPKINGATAPVTAGNITQGVAFILSGNGTGSNAGTGTDFTLAKEPANNVYGKIDLAYAVSIPLSSDSLRRRFEQAAALSFKIACS
jgi:hypothetical protein